MGPGGGFGHGKLKFDEEEAKPDISKALLLRIVKYFVPYWKQTLLVMTVLCISAVLGLLPPILIQQIIDRALPDRICSCSSCWLPPRWLQRLCQDCSACCRII